jgi:serine protease Do
MGVSITDVTPENSKFFDMTKASGAVVTQVQPDTPGAKAGLKIGDVITKMDGREVTDAGQLQVLVSQQQPGTTIHLDVVRDGKSMNIPVTVEELGGNKHGQETASNPQGKARWGLGLSDLNPDVREQLQAPNDVQGAVVERVVPGSPADNAGIASGDVIVSVDRKPVKSAQDVQQALSNVPAGQDALILVWSQGGNTFRVMHPGEHS